MTTQTSGHPSVGDGGWKGQLNGPDKLFRAGYRPMTFRCCREQPYNNTTAERTVNKQC
ncbi:MAG: hypothetical protein WC058_14290 [Phycisphaeraceae bacterium]